MKSSAVDEPRAPGQAPIKTRRFGISLVWIVPIVAVLVGISLVVHNLMQEGPTIIVNFKTGSVLTANKTEVKYRNVVIGQVTGVELSGDAHGVSGAVGVGALLAPFAQVGAERPLRVGDGIGHGPIVFALSVTGRSSQRNTRPVG